MFEIADRLLESLDAPGGVAVATAIDVLGSSPHPLGTSMATAGGTGEADRGVVIGSVSGGCVEAAALDGCARVLATGTPSVERFGFGDDAAARAGLACGGEIDVLFVPLAGECVRAELAAAAAGREACVAVVVSGPAAVLGGVICGGQGARLPGELTDDALGGLPGASIGRLRAALGPYLTSGRNGPLELDCDGTALRLFVEVSLPAAHFVIVGATEVGRALARAAAAVGYRVTVCDNRPAFASPDRAPGSAVVFGWPHEVLAGLGLDARSVVCVVSHDDDLDPLALATALDAGVGYVGALGSRATHTRRVERLRVLGVDESRIRGIHAPIGLDIGASSAAETAVSIMAEVIAARTGGSGDALRHGNGPIHRPAGFDRARPRVDTVVP